LSCQTKFSFLSLIAIKLKSMMCRPHKHEDVPIYRQILPSVRGIHHFYHHYFVTCSQHINTYFSIVATWKLRIDNWILHMPSCFMSCLMLQKNLFLLFLLADCTWCILPLAFEHNCCDS
jgi:hypothetical protein